MEVFAIKLTKRKIWYECPYCFTCKTGNIFYSSNYYKNNKIAINRHKSIHAVENETREIEDVAWIQICEGACSLNKNSIILNITMDTERR